MKRRGKHIAISTASAAIVALVASGIVVWPRIEEEWWLRRLKSEDEDERRHAAERLGTLGSVKAVPELILAMQQAIVASKRPGSAIARWERYGRRSWGYYPDFPREVLSKGVAFWQALVQIGRPALPGLIQTLHDGEDMESLRMNLISLAIMKIAYELPFLTPMQQAKAEEELELFSPASLLDFVAQDRALGQEVRTAAAAALKQIQGKQEAIVPHGNG